MHTLKHCCKPCDNIQLSQLLQLACKGLYEDACLASQDNAKTMKVQLDAQVKAVDQLKGNTRMLENKLAEAKSKKDTLKARAKSASTSKQINEMLQGLNTSSASSAFDRMEEKVMALEGESEAAMQVCRLCLACLLIFGTLSKTSELYLLPTHTHSSISEQGCKLKLLHVCLCNNPSPCEHVPLQARSPSVAHLLCLRLACACSLACAHDCFAVMCR